MKKLLLGLIILCFLVQTAMGQDPISSFQPPQVFSPVAAELGTFGKTSVNYYTGQANIMISLGTYEGHKHEVPIYLTYNASGNKPDQHQGIAGNGWTLHAGGCINRIVRGRNARGLLTGKLTKVLGGEHNNDYLWSVYYYDSEGRCIQENNSRLSGGADREETTYSFTGEVLGQQIIHDLGNPDTMAEQYTYSYDLWGRPQAVTHSLGLNAAKQIHAFSYDSLGRKVKDARSGVPQMEIRYKENIRGINTEIKAGASGGIFYEKMFPGWGGRLEKTEWRTGSDTILRSYQYTYNGYGFLTTAAYSASTGGSNFSRSYNYDLNGNIVSLVASNKPSGSLMSPGLLSAEYYSYSGNRLVGKSFHAIAPGAFILASVRYDSKGRMVQDRNQGIGRIKYNSLDLPSEVAFDGSLDTLRFVYASDGRKLGKSSSGLTRSWEGNQVYVNGVLDKLMIEDGYISVSDSSYHYFVYDHLGNVRAVTDDIGTVEQTVHYDPYGLELTDNNSFIIPTDLSGEDDNEYKWGGKEYDAHLSMYDFGARLYSPSLRRWTTPDPLAESFYRLSPYVYCASDPVNLVDPDGRKIVGVTREDARKAVNDIRTIFQGEEFDRFRQLIVQDGKHQNGKQLAMIDSKALASVFDGITLSEDQKALVDMAVNTINSSNIHVVEYVSKNDIISQAAGYAYEYNDSKRGIDYSAAIAHYGGVPAFLVNNDGKGGVTMPTGYIKKGSTHTVIVNDAELHPYGRSLTTGHELFGHARSLGLGRGDYNQHEDAIRTENLILRVMGIHYQNNGLNHGPKTYLPNASLLPLYR